MIIINIIILYFKHITYTDDNGYPASVIYSTVDLLVTLSTAETNKINYINIHFNLLARGRNVRQICKICVFTVNK